MNGIQSWLGDLSKESFFVDYFHQMPLSAADNAGPLAAGLCNWDIFGEILGRDHVDSMVCRQGERYAGPPPTSLTQAQGLIKKGQTILIRHAEQHHPPLHEVAAAFQHDFGGKVNVHLYATPASEFGFNWHYDAEDVFILQAQGAKEYSLRKNTVNPWPLEETIPQDMQFERETMLLMRCLLAQGDWLYIPAGYWHRGEARENSLSVAVGVMTPAAIDIHRLARQQLVRSLIWRQRLLIGDASPFSPIERRQQMRQTLKMLARDVAALFDSDEFLDAVLEHFAGDAGSGSGLPGDSNEDFQKK